MEVIVERNGVPMICRSEEQLRLFTSAGYVEKKTTPKKKAAKEQQETAEKQQEKPKSSRSREDENAI